MALTCPRCQTENDPAAVQCQRCYGSLAQAQPALAATTPAGAQVQAPAHSAATPFAPSGGVPVPPPPGVPGGATQPGSGGAGSAGGNGWAVRESPRVAAARLASAPPAPVRAAGPAAAVAVAAEPEDWAAAWQGVASTTAPPPRRGRLPGVVADSRVRLLAVALAGALVVVLFLHHQSSGGSATHTITLPATVAGQARVAGVSTVDAAMAGYDQQVKTTRKSARTLSAVYGKPAGQAGVLGAYELHLVLAGPQGLTTDEVLAALVRADPSVSVDVNGSVTRSVGGTDFLCTPLVDPRALSNTDTACLWQDNDVVGLLIAYSAANADLVANTAAQVQRAAEH